MRKHFDKRQVRTSSSRMTINKKSKIVETRSTIHKITTKSQEKIDKTLKEELKQFKKTDPRVIDEIDELKKIFYNFFVGAEKDSDDDL